MLVQIALSDDIAVPLTKKWGSLEQKVLEMLALEAYREGFISAGKVRSMLGLPTRLDVDRLMIANGIDLHYDEADLSDDRQTHEELRQLGKLNVS